MYTERGFGHDSDCSQENNVVDLFLYDSKIYGYMTGR